MKNDSQEHVFQGSDESVSTDMVELQKQDAVFPMHISETLFSEDWFYMILDNCETMLRTWVLFFPVKKVAFCFPCMRLQNAKRKHSLKKSLALVCGESRTPCCQSMSAVHTTLMHVQCGSNLK